ncbi:hypothetical protein CP10139811_0150 [Chlamydia ibidis]|uniref:Uncharacterized protein n=2 Tax=Chlamydia ibidis TaxID=1405396 RepID=S7KKW2_9CHLA|nr:hypothetical protein [Chlamydia ibidis]EPP35090.1 hypothetical protein CP10139811_0150 [Chlamydia ibidis]EQM62737.1 hypothetical protein H359_0593 [Chlamydia ibidis 10-1398/6]
MQNDNQISPQFNNNNDPSEMTSGVKDQNFYLKNSTLEVSEDLIIGDLLKADNLTVTNDVTVNPDLFVGGNVSGGTTTLHNLTLNGDFSITSAANGAISEINNISDPQSPRDALTFGYYKKTSLQAYNCMLGYAAQQWFAEKSDLTFKTFSSKDDETFTPLYQNCFTVESTRIILKRPGIYQVAYQVTRNWGGHYGDNLPSLYLRLNSMGSPTVLCSTDTRGQYAGDYTSVSLYAIFSLPITTTNNPYLTVNTTYEITRILSNISVIWFPFSNVYSEMD